MGGGPQSPVQLLEKIEKAHNSVKKQNFKKQKIFYLRSHNTSAPAKNQVSTSNCIGSRRRTKNQKNKKWRPFSQNSKILIFFKFILLTFSIKNNLPKIIFVPFLGGPQSPVQLLEKIEKAHNSVKKQNFKKQKIFYLRSHNTSAHAKNQVSTSNGIGSRRRTKNQKNKTWRPFSQNSKI